MSTDFIVPGGALGIKEYGMTVMLNGTYISFLIQTKEPANITPTNQNNPVSGDYIRTANGGSPQKLSYYAQKSGNFLVAKSAAYGENVFDGIEPQHFDAGDLIYTFSSASGGYGYAFIAAL